MILREAFDYEMSILSPTGAHIDPSHLAAYETLVTKGVDWQAHPRLAESWEISEDGLEWRFRLRPGARFHSGAPCDARAVIAVLDHLRYTFPLGQLWYWDPVDTVHAEGDDLLVFRLHYPYIRLPSILWGTHSTIYNEALRAADPDAFGVMVADGTGPFRLASWAPDRLTVERFPGYGGPAPKLDGIEWKTLLDPAARLAALERGEVDVLHSPPMAEIDRLRDDGRFRVVEHPQPASLYLGLDWRRDDLGFDDLDVRRAISLAVDRDAIVREVFHGHAAPSWGPVPTGDEFYDPAVDRGRRRDVQEAIALLRGRTVRCECVVQDDVFIGHVGRLVAAQLAEVGVQLDLRPEKPFAPFYGACAAGPPAFVSKWLWPDSIDAIIGFASTRCKGYANWQHASIPSLDAAFEEWLRARTRDELQQAASRVQTISVEELPYVPLVTPNDVWVHSASVHGFEPHPADLYPLYDGVSVR
jgi:peptide/nickel transport system substrate-binding protein